MPADESDETLMVRFQGGDRPALVLLVRRHQSRLYNFALRHVKSSPAAEEIVQETFVRVLQNAAYFGRSSPFQPWFYAIARNLCVDFLRKGAHRRHSSLDDAQNHDQGESATLVERTADERANVEKAVLSTEFRQRLLEAVADLPEEQREVFLLREVSSLSFHQIAQIVGAPENTVKSRMRYALERLQLALSSFEEYARALR